MSAWLDIALEAVAAPMTHALLHFIWQGMLVALLLAGVLLIARPRSARVRYRLACGALLAMVLLPAFTALTYDVGVRRPIASETVADESPASSRSEATRLDTAETVRRLARTVPADQAGGGLATRLLHDVSWRIDRPDASRWILAVWLGGVALLSLSHVGGWLKVRRLRGLKVAPLPDDWERRADRLRRSMGVDRAVRVLRSAAVEVPTVIGWLRPVILVPVGALSGLSVAQLECILAHELAHIRRRDYLVNLLQTCAETLLFYHPAVWWVSRLIRSERENCCDDLAVAMSGDSIGYARALLDLEELRLDGATRPAPALGADGGSLTHRVKRLIGGNDMTLHYRHSHLAGTLAALVLMLGVSTLSLSAQPEFHDVLAMASGKTGEEVLRGRWYADRDGDELYLELSRHDRGDRRRGDWRTSLQVDLDDLDGLTFGEDAEFTLRREAGTFSFRGDFEGRRGKEEGDGSFTYVSDSEYLKRVQRHMTEDLEDSHAVVLATVDLRSKTVEELREHGYGPFDSDDIVSIGIFGVTGDYIRGMEREGFRDLDLGDLVSMRVHGIDRDFVGEMRELYGEDLDLGDVMSFKIHGVDREYQREMADAGYDLDPEDLLSWKIHGVTPGYAEKMRRAGFELDAQDLLSWKIHNVTPAYAERMRKAGYELDGDDLLSWRIHGVSAEFIESMRELGFKGDADDLLSFKIHGISRDYARSVKRLGYDLDPDDLLSWKIHGVSGGYIEALAELGYRDIDADDLVSMRIHGVTPSWIDHLQERGIDDLTVKELIRLRISGVDL